MISNTNRYFLTIVECKNISKAAEKLYISQPSLSKYLKRLENSIGIKLFFRNHTQLELTYAGELYLEYVKDVEFKKNILKQQLLDINKSTTGKLTIGITTWRATVFLPRVLASFYKKYPYINIELCEGSHKDIFSAMDKHEVDFCIVSHLPELHNYTVYHIEYEKIVLAINKDADILKKTGLTYNPKRKKLLLADFNLFHDEPLIQLKLGQYLRTEVTHFLNKGNFKNRVILETENIITALNIAAEGMGITFVPEKYIYSEQRNKKLAFFEMSNHMMKRELVLAHHAEYYPSRNFRLFIDHIKNIK